MIQKNCLFSLFIILVIGLLSVGAIADEQPPAVKKLEEVTINLTKEMQDLNSDFQRTIKAKDPQKPLYLLLLQKQTNHVLTVLYDTMAFLILYDRLEAGCKGEAARIVGNRLLYARDILVSTKGDIDAWQRTLAKEGHHDLSGAYKRTVSIMKKAEKTLNNLTHFMKSSEK